MKFQAKTLRSLIQIRRAASTQQVVRFTFSVSGISPEVWIKLGFNQELEAGQKLLPAGIAKISVFNALGKEIIRKDLPKIARSYPSFRTWKDWHGREHSGIQYRTIDVYPREYVEAPAEAFFVMGDNSDMRICTREVNVLTESDESILHLANLMLECFGSFEMVDSKTGIKIGTNVKNLQWEILPAGSYPWAQTSPIISRNIGSLDDSAKELIRYRMASIAGFLPDFLAIGKGGFNAYFVYGFEAKGIYVLESGHLNNATYVFNQDWENLSQLTKNEIISGKLPHTRIIHDRRWLQNLGKIIRTASRS